MSNDDITLVIADDHPIFRKGLRDILEEEGGFRVLGECEDGPSALDCIRTLKPHVALLDMEMPGMTGLDVAAVVHRDRLPVAMVMLTIANRIEIFNRAVDYGVVGYILKDAAATDLVTGLRAVVRGKYFFSPSLAARAVVNRNRHDDSPHIPDGLDQLTPTERKVLDFIAENRSTTEIAHVLSISVRTVEKHRANIAEKLDLHGSYALVRFALQNRELFQGP